MPISCRHRGAHRLEPIAHTIRPLTKPSILGVAMECGLQRAENECSAEYGMKRCSYGMFSTRAVVLAAWSFFFSRESSERQEHG